MSLRNKEVTSSTNGAYLRSTSTSVAINFFRFLRQFTLLSWPSVNYSAASADLGVQPMTMPQQGITREHFMQRWFSLILALIISFS